MTAVVIVGSGHGLRIEAHCRNQTYKTKLSLYNLLFHFIKWFKTVVHKYSTAQFILDRTPVQQGHNMTHHIFHFACVQAFVHTQG